MPKLMVARDFGSRTLRLRSPAGTSSTENLSKRMRRPHFGTLPCGGSSRLISCLFMLAAIPGIVFERSNFSKPV